MEYRNEVIKDLHDVLQIPIVFITQNSKRPQFPYISYTIINTDKVEAEHNVNEIVPGTDFEFDIKDTLNSELLTSISFTAHSPADNEAYAEAKLAHNYFRHLNFYDKNYVVVDVMAIEDRSVLEVDKYVHKHGFDVIIRESGSVNKLTPTIESHKIEGGI